MKLTTDPGREHDGCEQGAHFLGLTPRGDVANDRQACALPAKKERTGGVLGEKMRTVFAAMPSPSLRVAFVNPALRRCIDVYRAFALTPAPSSLCLSRARDVNGSEQEAVALTPTASKAVVAKQRPRVDQ